MLPRRRPADREDNEDLEIDDVRTFVLAPAPTGTERWRQLSDIALGRYFLLLAWAALYLAMLAGAQAVDWTTTSQEESDRNYGRKVREQEAREGRERRDAEREARRRCGRERRNDCD